jgi:hypothetical protein
LISFLQLLHFVTSMYEVLTFEDLLRAS